METSEKEILNVDFIKKYIHDDALFDKEKCIDDYMKNREFTYEQAEYVIDNYLNKYFTIYKVSNGSFLDKNHSTLVLYLVVIFCYCVGYLKYPDSFKNTVLLAIAVFLLICFACYAFKYLAGCYTTINSDLVEKCIKNNQLDIKLCTKKYTHYHKDENEEEVMKKITEYYYTNYKLIERPIKESIFNIDSNSTTSSSSNGPVFKSNITSRYCCLYCGSRSISLVDDAPGGYTANSYGPVFSRNINDRYSVGYGMFHSDVHRKKKKVFSRKKLMGGLLTGGASLFVTGARTKVSQVWMCNECYKTFYMK